MIKQMKDDYVERVARAIAMHRTPAYADDKIWAEDIEWQRRSIDPASSFNLARAALSAMPGRFYWLIERSAPRELFWFAEGAPIYVCLIYGKPWTDKADEALRFSRREDATQYWHRYEAGDPELRIVEHGDIPALPERELLREALGALQVFASAAERVDAGPDLEPDGIIVGIAQAKSGRGLPYTLSIGNLRRARAAADKIRAALREEQS